MNRSKQKHGNMEIMSEKIRDLENIFRTCSKQIIGITDQKKRSSGKKKMESEEILIIKLTK